MVYNVYADTMNYKGFTLIELLAVIVVLAVISLITVPILLNVVKTAKIESEKASVREIYSSVVRKSITEDNIVFSDDIMKKLDLKGKKPTDGEIFISTSQKKVLIKILYDNNCYIKIGNSEIEIMDKNNCVLTKYYDSFKTNVENVNQILVDKGSGINSNETVNYKDTVISKENNKYIFKGKDPMNYLSFGNACFRILSYGDEGIKIIYDGSTDASKNPCAHQYNGSIGLLNYKGSIEEMSFGTTGDWFKSDVKNYFESLLNDTSVLNNNEIIIGKSNLGTITLNELEKKSIIKGKFNAGDIDEAITKQSGTIEQIENSEKILRKDNTDYIYSGYIGLITMSEYLKASSNTDCKTYAPFGSGVEDNNPCNDNNYLNKVYGYWTMNRIGENINNIHYVPFKSYYYSSDTVFYVRPVMFLKNDTLFYGTGTFFDPYRLTN